MANMKRGRSDHRAKLTLTVILIKDVANLSKIREGLLHDYLNANDRILLIQAR